MSSQNKPAHALRKASTKTVEQGTFYCEDSHKTGFQLGLVFMCFFLSLEDIITRWFPETVVGLDKLDAVIPWLMGVALLGMLVRSYPYLMNGKRADGQLYDDVDPESDKPRVEIYLGKN